MIHRIYSTLPTFKGLVFKSGLNVMLAQKTDGATSKQTRNRAGKTSLIEIVHFLTGAEAGKESLLRTEALADSTFGMEFDLAGHRTTVERQGASKAKIEVYGDEFPNGRARLSNTEWANILGDQMFGLQKIEGDKGRSPKFRSLFAYFVRRQLSGAYTAPEKQATMQQLGDLQMALMFLMGLDWQIARDWQVIRDREKTLEELKKAAGVGAFGNIIGKAADLRTQLTVSAARLKKLRDEVGQFRVLPQYGEMELEASQITRELNELANGNTIDLSAVRDLELAVELEEAPSLDDVQAVYQEAGVVLPGVVQKRYEDVRSFHESVIRNRRDYLAGELEAAKSRMEIRNQQKARLDERRAELMGILKSHGALDQFTQLQGEVGRLESEVETLTQRFEAAEKLEGTKNELEIERNRLALRLRRDFAEQKERLAEAILAFEETSKRLYESAGSMLVEETSNGPVFKFPMQGSRSKGIKSMQIYCFDMMLMRLCAKRGIGPGFLIHDSHLFDGVDGRQVISALRVGAETSEELGFQYIVTMNEDDAFKEKEDGFDLNDYVLPLRLTDATEDGGLFGIRFD
ncbi:MAG TPA: ABC-three component system protein [Thermoanaerobaculia bacterium]|nr:ABC-three component system protein [Thermoanaerobaculia bacterium]